LKAVILAAGKGSRLSPFSEILPKPLMPIGLNPNGAFKTIVEYLIEQIVNAGIKTIYIIVNYKSDLIMNYLKEGDNWGVKIVYFNQSVLDGNGGAFYRVQDLIGEDPVLISDCDNYISDSQVLSKMVHFHNIKKAEITVGVSSVMNVEKFAIIKEKNMVPTDIKEKPKSNEGWGNLAKSGILILSNKIAMLNKEIALTENGEYTTTEIVKYGVVNNSKVELFSIKDNFHDIGTWDEYIPILAANLK